MKVIYETILDKIKDTILEARSENKVIKKIVLTRSEWCEFTNTIDVFLTHYNDHHTEECRCSYMGVQISLEEWET